MAGRPKKPLSDAEAAKWSELYQEARNEPMDYISHDVSAHDNEKIRRMMARLGWGSYGMYWCLVELLARRRMHCYRVEDELGWQFLARDMSTAGLPMEVGECQSFVGELASLGLIENESFGNGLVIMERVCESAEEYAQSVARKRFAGWMSAQSRSGYQ